mmetsp:Transcript_8857/g.26185  ORF Transcript_8857/g.26185 Transcript_8857/m.26185 type:complete len:1016 (-) Transcript_8857:2428-5475(-)
MHLRGQLRLLVPIVDAGELQVHVLGVVVAGGALEDVVRRLLGPEGALEVHEGHPDVEALLGLGEANVLDGALRHLPGTLQVAHLQVERHVLDPDDGGVALGQEHALEVLDALRVGRPASIGILGLTLLQLLVGSRLLGLLLALGGALAAVVLVVVVLILLPVLGIAVGCHLEVRKLEAGFLVLLRGCGQVPRSGLIVRVRSLGLDVGLGLGARLERRRHLLHLRLRLLLRPLLGRLRLLSALRLLGELVQQIVILVVIIVVVTQLILVEERRLDAQPHLVVFQFQHLRMRYRHAWLIRVQRCRCGVRDLGPVHQTIDDRIVEPHEEAVLLDPLHAPGDDVADRELLHGQTPLAVPHSQGQLHAVVLGVHLDHLGGLDQRPRRIELGDLLLRNQGVAESLEADARHQRAAQSQEDALGARVDHVAGHDLARLQVRRLQRPHLLGALLLSVHHGASQAELELCVRVVLLAGFPDDEGLVHLVRLQPLQREGRPEVEELRDVREGVASAWELEGRRDALAGDVPDLVEARERGAPGRRARAALLQREVEPLLGAVHVQHFRLVDLAKLEVRGEVVQDLEVRRRVQEGHVALEAGGDLEPDARALHLHHDRRELPALLQGGPLHRRGLVVRGLPDLADERRLHGQLQVPLLAALLAVAVLRNLQDASLHDRALLRQSVQRGARRIAEGPAVVQLRGVHVALDVHGRRAEDLQPVGGEDAHLDGRPDLQLLARAQDLRDLALVLHLDAAMRAPYEHAHGLAALCGLCRRTVHDGGPRCGPALLPEGRREEDARRLLAPDHRVRALLKRRHHLDRLHLLPGTRIGSGRVSGELVLLLRGGARREEVRHGLLRRGREQLRLQRDVRDAARAVKIQHGALHGLALLQLGGAALRHVLLEREGREAVVVLEREQSPVGLDGADHGIEDGARSQGLGGGRGAGALLLPRGSHGAARGEVELERLRLSAEERRIGGRGGQRPQVRREPLRGLGDLADEDPHALAWRELLAGLLDKVLSDLMLGGNA